MFVCRNGIVFQSIEIYSTSSNNTIAIEASLHLPNFIQIVTLCSCCRKSKSLTLEVLSHFLYGQLLVYVAFLPFPSVASIECSTSLVSSESILLWPSLEGLLASHNHLVEVSFSITLLCIICFLSWVMSVSVVLTLIHHSRLRKHFPLHHCPPKKHYSSFHPHSHLCSRRAILLRSWRISHQILLVHC